MNRYVPSLLVLIMVTHSSVGFLLHKINGERVDGLPFRTVLEVIRKAKTPHQAVFHRYDYRFNAIIGQWQSLQELRDMG